MVTFMSCHKLVCFPVALSNKIGMFIVYGNVWKTLASDVLLCFLANCMKLYFCGRMQKNSKFFVLLVKKRFSTPERSTFSTL